MSNNIISILVEDNTYVMKMKGELRFSFAPSIIEALRMVENNASIQNVILDLSETRFLDSTIIGTLLNFFLKEDIWRRFSNNPPRIVTKNPDLIKTLSIIGVDIFFPIVENEPKLKSLKSNYVEIKKILEEKEILEKYVKDSHRTLSKLNPRSDFQDVGSHIKH